MNDVGNVLYQEELTDYSLARIPEILGGRWLEGVMRPIIVALAGSMKRPYYRHARERLCDASRDDLEVGMEPMLQRESRLGAADRRARAWWVIEPMTAPTPAEREFSERLRLHPRRRRKAGNATAHRTGRHATEETL